MLALVIVGAAWAVQWQQRTENQDRIEQQLVGVSWHLTDVSSGDQHAQVPTGQRLELKLDADGTAVLEKCAATTGQWQATNDGFELIDPQTMNIACQSLTPQTQPSVDEALQQVAAAPVAAARHADSLTVHAGRFILTFAAAR
ncbi:META domain-containing protein [Nakamurella endophytica]|uniref:META domain-containing protein n=1 Tax=Nakamurella endophytica TaxID=1748367 RepID=UPI00166F1BC1|nr:META domain-containing protein [Nakamurella endophytica]